MRCPNCGNELDEDNYCSECCEFFNEDENSYDFEKDYDSMVNNGDNICLNCTFWSVSPYGAAHGMVCRKGQMSYGPEDSCDMFIKEQNFANYGENGEYQFDETGNAISNKLYHWRNGR